MSDQQGVPLDHDNHQPQQDDFQTKVKKKIASKNWTYPLLVGSFLSAGGLVASGVLGFIPGLSTTELNPLHYVVCIYIIALGILMLGSLVTVPEAWYKLNLKWVPFLHTFRGRGLYLIFLGSLSTGTGAIGIAIGIVVIIIGLAHVLLAFFFRNTLSASKEFNERGSASNVSGDDVKRDLAGVAVQTAWNNRESFQ
eukprot:TRINITY_DN8366_c0_g1_i1.p1 TRINITY_DN8366_c0_g1~~TRINITY_DN8366_c0_g1_i1.p1  ORF type:complete len:196 (-),score=37.68 TRINITY_DN8366_c0_g1_i1:72-659(-)